MLSCRATVIFDFDYTLADSSAGVIECANYALRTMGLPESHPETIKALIGVSLDRTFALLAGDRQDGRFEEFKRHFTDRGDQVMLENTRLFEAVAPVVTALRASGVRLGIVSTKFRYRIAAFLEREGLDQLFDVIVGGEDVAVHKPDPTGLFTAMERLKATPAQTLYVGDSAVDAETAERAGVAFVAVLSGVTPREAFAGHPVRAILADLSDLPDIVS